MSKQKYVLVKIKQKGGKVGQHALYPFVPIEKKSDIDLGRTS